jgi:anti-sigma28 factor (negative regulator of flagellin synthesis)
MKIYDTNQQPAAVTSGTREAQRPDPSGARVSITGARIGGQPPDHVQLSNLGSQMGAELASPDREARITQMAALYQAGSYKVDAHALSGRILDDSTFVR